MSYSDINSDGGMDPRSRVEDSMYRLTVAQRDSAWREAGYWRERYETLLKMLADNAGRLPPSPPPVMLADKESFEAGRVMERAAMMQLFTDPENQPTQHGTVTVEYMEREIAVERAAKDELLAALQDLLMDTQHAEHECDDKNCPVARAVDVALKYEARRTA